MKQIFFIFKGFRAGRIYKNGFDQIVPNFFLDFKDLNRADISKF